MALKKGQYIRLFLGDDNTTTPTKCIAAAKNLTLHVSATVESASTKDTDEGDWDVPEITAINYDISSSALIRSGETIESLVGAQELADIEDIYEDGTPVMWQIAEVSGDNNRTKGTVLVYGSATLTQLVMNGPNRQNATYDVTLQGWGIYSV
jgi:predicted secreted protein